MYGYHTKRCAQGIFPVKTVDTTAAGDTFTGYFVGEIINGKTPEEALKTAAMASAIAVGKRAPAHRFRRLRKSGTLYKNSGNYAENQHGKHTTNVI